MRTLLLCLALPIVGGCSTETPESVCEHLVALREASASTPDPQPRAARMGKCIDQVKVAKKAMGDEEWKTFGPCAVAAKDVSSLVACSPTMQEAANAATQRRKEKQAAIKARMFGDGKAGDSKAGDSKASPTDAKADAQPSPPPAAKADAKPAP